MPLLNSAHPLMIFATLLEFVVVLTRTNEPSWNLRLEIAPSSESTFVLLVFVFGCDETEVVVDAGADVVVDNSNDVAAGGGDRIAAAAAAADDDAANAGDDDDDTVDDKGNDDIRNDDGSKLASSKDVTTFVFEDEPTLMSWKVL